MDLLFQVLFHRTFVLLNSTFLFSTIHYRLLIILSYGTLAPRPPRADQYPVLERASCLQRLKAFGFTMAHQSSFYPFALHYLESKSPWLVLTPST